MASSRALFNSDAAVVAQTRQGQLPKASSLLEGSPAIPTEKLKLSIKKMFLDGFGSPTVSDVSAQQNRNKTETAQHIRKLHTSTGFSQTKKVNLTSKALAFGSFIGEAIIECLEHAENMEIPDAASYVTSVALLAHSMLEIGKSTLRINKLKKMEKNLEQDSQFIDDLLSLESSNKGQYYIQLSAFLNQEKPSEETDQTGIGKLEEQLHYQTTLLTNIHRDEKIISDLEKALRANNDSGILALESELNLLKQKYPSATNNEQQDSNQALRVLYFLIAQCRKYVIGKHNDISNTIVEVTDKLKKRKAEVLAECATVTASMDIANKLTITQEKIEQQIKWNQDDIQRHKILRAMNVIKVVLITFLLTTFIVTGMGIALLPFIFVASEAVEFYLLEKKRVNVDPDNKCHGAHRLKKSEMALNILIPSIFILVITNISGINAMLAVGLVIVAAIVILANLGREFKHYYDSASHGQTGAKEGAHAHQPGLFSLWKFYALVLSLFKTEPTADERDEGQASCGQFWSSPVPSQLPTLETSTTTVTPAEDKVPPAYQPLLIPITNEFSRF